MTRSPVSRVILNRREWDNPDTLPSQLVPLGFFSAGQVKMLGSKILGLGRKGSPWGCLGLVKLHGNSWL